MADFEKPHLIVVNNWVEIITANENVATNMNEVHIHSCKSLAKLAKELKIEFDGYIVVGKASKAATWPMDEKENKAFIHTGKEPPLAEMTRPRTDDTKAQDFWEKLRFLLSHKELAESKYPVQLIIITPFQHAAILDEDNQDRKWVLDKVKNSNGKLTVKTVLIGGQEINLVNAEKISGTYINPHVVKVYQVGIDYGHKTLIANVDPLAEWLATNILSKASPGRLPVETAKDPLKQPEAGLNQPEMKTPPLAEAKKDGDHVTVLKNTLQDFWDKRAKENGSKDDPVVAKCAANISYEGIMNAVNKAIVEGKSAISRQEAIDYLFSSKPDVGNAQTRKAFIGNNGAEYTKFLMKDEIKELLNDVMKQRIEQRKKDNEKPPGMGNVPEELREPLLDYRSSVATLPLGKEKAPIIV